jgi:RsiW-degrading membrane proteinase PrsW (M82 family)
VKTCPHCGADPGSRWFCRSCGAPIADRQLAAPLHRKPFRQRRIARILLVAVALTMILCTILLVAAALEFDWAAFGIALVLALVPACLYSWLVLRVDVYEKEPTRTIVAAFAWGAVAAVLMAIVLEALTGSALIFVVGVDAASVLSSVVGAPVIEEATKGIAILGLLWFFREEFDNILDGLVYGALIGLGFAMTENVLYLGTEYIDEGAGAMGELFVIRVVLDGFGHAVYTATTGAAVGWSRSRYDRGAARYAVPVIGFSLAVLQHALWNGTLVFIDNMVGDDVSIWRVVLIQAPIYTMLPLFVLFLIARAAGRRELAIMREQLAPEVAYGVLTPEEFAAVTDPRLRRLAIGGVRRRGDRELIRIQRRFNQVAAELAFRKYHLSRGERPRPNQIHPEDAYRAELAYLRAALNPPPSALAA